MTHDTASAFGQPSLQELTARFFATGSDNVESGEMGLYEVATGFKVDPRAAWTDATATLTATPAQLPPDWAGLVNPPAPPTVGSLAMAAGNYPQRVRDLHPLLVSFHPERLRPHPDQPPMSGLTGLRSWIASHTTSHPILSAGLARLLGDFANAEKLLPANAENERAALLWHRGRCREALDAWNHIAESPAVLFNRGMAQLFLGSFAAAKENLTQAVNAIPETSGWNALARLYLAVAEIHG
jgi:hypothetical protein